MKYLFMMACIIGITTPAVVMADDTTCSSASYYIQNVETNAIAATSEDARSAATSEGLMVAWQRLHERLLISDNGSIDSVDSSFILPYLDYTRLVQETVLPTRYQAEFDYCFDRLKIRDYFAAQQYRHAELLSEPILILPIWMTPEGPHLWRKPNPWGEAWVDLLRQHDGLLNLRLPSTLATERAIDVVPLMARDAATISKAAELESTERVLLMVMSPQQDDGNNIRIDVTADLYDRYGVFESTAYSLRDTTLKTSDLLPSIRGIAHALLDGVEDVWRIANEVNVKEGGVIMVTVKSRSLKEWRSHLNILQSLPPVDQLSIVQLGSKGGLVRIKLSGSITSLNYALEAHGLEVSEERQKNQSYLSLMPIIY